ncbi:hypothetical protein AMTR_s00018p00205440 [Amborella trichopoda]|uniref:Uncharacterized protein n=1 Tax=Amborella trichopoda TaxID=13333 RepID=W1PM63_AMBTC|nr:hypothetical protein AMTR_s00018p00205440 [Amborella trichopoda]
MGSGMSICRVCSLNHYIKFRLPRSLRQAKALGTLPRARQVLGDWGISRCLPRWRRHHLAGTWRLGIYQCTENRLGPWPRGVTLPSLSGLGQVTLGRVRARPSYFAEAKSAEPSYLAESESLHTGIYYDVDYMAQEKVLILESQESQMSGIVDHICGMVILSAAALIHRLQT